MSLMNMREGRASLCRFRIFHGGGIPTKRIDCNLEDVIRIDSKERLSCTGPEITVWNGLGNDRSRG